MDVESSIPPVSSETTPSAGIDAAILSTEEYPQVTIVSKNEGVLVHSNTEPNTHKEENTGIASIRQQTGDDDGYMPITQMNSNSTGAPSIKKTVKKISSSTANYSYPSTKLKPKMTNQSSTTKRLPTLTAKGQVPMVSLPSSGLKAPPTSKASSLVDEAPQTKKRKKVTRPVGDNAHLADGSPSKMTHNHPILGGQSQPSPPHLSTAQAAVNEMMRTALQEYQYSAMGSIVETDDESLDESGEVDVSLKNENDYLTRVWCVEGSTNTSPTLTKLNRSLILTSMKKVLRMEGNAIQQSFPHNYTSKRDSTWENDDHEESYLLQDQHDDKYDYSLDDEQEDDEVKIKGNERRAQDTYSKVDSTAQSSTMEHHTEDLHSKKKRKRGNRREGEIEGGNGTAAVNDIKVNDHLNHDVSDLEAVQGAYQSTKVSGQGLSQVEDYYEDEGVDRKDIEESSIFGQTIGSANATWVECDKCGKWRRLRGIVDASKLPTKWYCSMNKRDPERAKCTAPEEKYDAAANTPESAADQRARKHLRLWVRRLHTSENYEARMGTVTRGKKKNNAMTSKEPYEWIRCCNPSCGKWRALLKFMDSSSVVEAAKNGEWYCVMNTWDEKLASCAAPQEHLPINAPQWVQRDDIM